MKLDLTRSQPDKWFNQLRETSEIKLKKNEIPAAIVFFEMTNKMTNELMYCIFTVIKTATKAIARNIIVHHNDSTCKDDQCEGHSRDLAEYPLENTQELCEETIQHALTMGQMLASDPTAPTSIDTSKPVVCIQCPQNATQEGFVRNLNNQTNQQLTPLKNIIANVLDIKNVITQNNNTEETIQQPSIYGFNAQEISQSIPSSITIDNLQNNRKAEENLERAAKESELIKKYGKKQIELLAKKIKYKGQIINNKKKKSHAKNSK